jgi:membrane-bound metal-dependent hydrolase YbcI (DUF457 family)
VLGRDHILLAGVATLGLAPIVDHSIIHDPIDLVLATVIAAGFGLLPDIDEPGSTISNKLGSTTGHRSIVAPITRLISHIVRKIGGGHRMLTHSLLFCAIVGIGFYELDAHWAVWTGAITFFLAAGLTMFALLPLDLGRSKLITPIVAIGGGAYLYYHPFAPITLAFVVAAGTALHLLGDFLTKDGIPILFPLRKHFALPLVGRTGGSIESIFGVLLSLGFLVLLFYNVVLPIAHGGIHLPGLLSSGVNATKQLVNKGSKMSGITGTIHLPSFADVQFKTTQLEGWIGGHIFPGS